MWNTKVFIVGVVIFVFQTPCHSDWAFFYVFECLARWVFFSRSFSLCCLLLHLLLLLLFPAFFNFFFFLFFLFSVLIAAVKAIVNALPYCVQCTRSPECTHGINYQWETLRRWLRSFMSASNVHLSPQWFIFANTAASTEIPTTTTPTTIKTNVNYFAANVKSFVWISRLIHFFFVLLLLLSSVWFVSRYVWLVG